MGASQRDGLIGDRNDMAFVRVFDHAFALRFLASVYGDEEDLDHRQTGGRADAGGRLRRQGADLPRRLGLPAGSGRQ